jgi:hypothetical protein
MKGWVKRTAVSLLAGLTLFASGCKKQEAVQEAQDNSGFRIGYAQGVTVVDSEFALRREYEAMLEASKQEGMSLEFTNEAYSLDGVNVNCYIANSPLNSYDMFIIIYGDEDFTDQLYLSELLRPGTAFEHIQLEHALDPGSHTVYVVYTTVEEADGEQAIHDQQIVTMNIQVLSEEEQTAEQQESTEENGQ